ncbi:hypothetical protein [Paraburkholderia gardini]|nr:hypothetical protein [Paraburkholderia gardini]CAG4899363.1 hypothetical protein R69919_02599 [Paraburkholderia gardini]
MSQFDEQCADATTASDASVANIARRRDQSGLPMAQTSQETHL